MTTAVRPRRASGLRTFVDPWPLLGGASTWALAVTAVALGLAASRAGVRFDGALDVHPAALVVPVPPVPVATAVADQAAAVLAPAVVAWVVLRALGARAPLDRCVALFAAARLPLVLSAPLALLTVHALSPQTTAGATAPGAAPPFATPGFEVLLLAMGAAVLFVWYVALVVAAVRTLGGVQGGRLAGATAATLLGGELLSKLVLAFAG